MKRSDDVGVEEVSEHSLTSQLFDIELPWPGATGNTQARHGKHGSYLNPLVARYRAVVAQTASGQGWGSWGTRKSLLGPLALNLLLAPPDRRARDADNVAKVLCDSLVHAGVLSDDSNKVVSRLTIEWTDPEPGGRVLVTIRPYKSQCHG
jgi:Holliday junction resolvase RusA-like endonuclease